MTIYGKIRRIERKIKKKRAMERLGSGGVTESERNRG